MSDLTTVEILWLERRIENRVRFGHHALHSRRHDDEVQLYAFDILALDGEDLLGLPLSMSKTNLRGSCHVAPMALSRGL